ncbi:MAG: peptidoglycan-binding domain-containing protein [Paracoccaceae bacterium]
MGTDGIFGPNTFSALRKYQRAMGNVPDGFPTSELLQKLRQQDK